MKKHAIMLFLFSASLTLRANDDFTCPVSDQKPSRVQIDNDTEAPFVDKDRELKDFSTDFVVNEFFREKQSLFNFLRLVYGTLDKKLRKYRNGHDLSEDSIVLLFKGGNVFRILAQNFLSMVPAQARELLSDQYSKYFKRSDADFSILIDEKELNNLDYDKVMDDVVSLTYDGLNYIRKKIDTDPDTYFDFAKLKSSMAQRIFYQYLQRLADIDSIKNQDNDKWYGAKFYQIQLLDESAISNRMCRYQGQYDYEYSFSSKNDNQIIGTPLTWRSHWIMNSINRTLEWSTENIKDPKLVHFHLVRAKVQFEYTYQTHEHFKRRPIGGELIDVSLPYRDDFKIRDFLDEKQSLLHKLSLKLRDTDESIEMVVESLEGLADDLYGILFKQFEHPWDDRKYEKRIHRLGFLAIIDMLGEWGAGSNNAAEYIADVEDMFIDPLRKLYPLDEGSDEYAETLLGNALQLKESWPTMKTANIIWTGIAHLIKETLVKYPKDDDEKELEGLISTIADDLAVMRSLAEMKPSKINLKNIYESTMDNLL